MANETNIISKLTKGLKFKINKKKKNTWKTLNSNESLPPTPTDEEYMLYSDTEAELFKAKVNVEANRSFSFNNTNNTNNTNTENTMNTKNILSGLNNTPAYTSNVIGRSKTYNNRTTYTYNNRPTFGAQAQNQYLYTPNTITESRKNSFQTVCPPQHVNSTQPISIQYTSSSNNTTPYSSVPNSPISIDSSDTYVNNPFIKNNAKPKVNNFLTVSTTNIDPALSHSLISPIEFDGAGKEIKKSTSTTTTTNVNVIVSTENNTTEQPVRNKSVKRIKPLITFDTPPVVTPITADSDSDEYLRGRKRSGKKHKKYSKKRSSLTLKTKELKDMSNNKVSSEPSSAVIAARAHMRLNSPNSVSTEEDDDVPLGIIQYKCISSILKETGPTNISSLQSNTKKSHKSKNNYGYMSPPRESFLEKKPNKKPHKRSSGYLKGKLILHKKSSQLKNTITMKLDPPLSPPHHSDEPTTSNSRRTSFFGNYFDFFNSLTNQKEVDDDDDDFNANYYFHQYRDEDVKSPKQSKVEIRDIYSSSEAKSPKQSKVETKDIYSSSEAKSPKQSKVETKDIFSASGSPPITINYANSNLNAEMKSNNRVDDFVDPNPYMNLDDVHDDGFNTNMYNPFDRHQRIKNMNFLFDEYAYKTY